MVSIAIYSKSEAGHREAYIKFVKELFPAKRISGWALIKSKEPVLFLMIEECFFLYMAVCMVRMLTRRRTVGLLFRPIPALEGKSLRLVIKRWMLIALKRFSLVSTLSIVPTSIHKSLTSIVSGYIYDFQLWDLSKEDRAYFLLLKSGLAKNEERALYDKIQEIKFLNKTLVAIGRQDESKGFDEFIKACKRSKSENSKLFFVAGGKISESLKALVTSTALGTNLIIDRYIDNSEILQLYSSADLVWCFYSKDYDQASGILGRAIQLGIPVLVRDGSISHRLCLNEKIPHIALSKIDELDPIIAANMELYSNMGMDISNKFRDVSLMNLSIAFGFQKQVQ